MTTSTPTATVPCPACKGSGMLDIDTVEFWGRVGCPRCRGDGTVSPYCIMCLEPLGQCEHETQPTGGTAAKGETVNLCHDQHQEVCFDGRVCPVCEKLEEIEDLKNKIEELETEIASQ